MTTSHWQAMGKAPKGAIGITLRLRSGREVDANWDEPDPPLGPDTALSVSRGRWVPMDEREDPIPDDDPPVEWKPID
jgi:hypothetical protein